MKLQVLLKLNKTILQVGSDEQLPQLSVSDSSFQAMKISVDSPTDSVEYIVKGDFIRLVHHKSGLLQRVFRVGLAFRDLKACCSSLLAIEKGARPIAATIEVREMDDITRSGLFKCRNKTLVAQRLALRNISRMKEMIRTVKGIRYGLMGGLMIERKEEAEKAGNLEANKSCVDVIVRIEKGTKSALEAIGKKAMYGDFYFSCYQHL
ncbi:hypothetical protein UCRPC4_g05521 [Phaeomoniella chlamydospora]|uniref:Uncharacterized protein n=1 Tax=Phaeomoniella chlamydospora TaxID=158046 RepID=A0A0G2E5A0_PHACM|nr:hypothetical protein UCRPC4_g05521 [Phaeomoniella chlamydospora]